MLKKIVAVTIIITSLLFCNAFALQKDVPILLYHNIADTFPAQNNLLHITPNDFRQHMQALNNAGYIAISYADYIAYVKGKADIPDKSIIITFDDGYQSNYDYAFPILKEFGMKATIFIVTNSVGYTTTEYPHFGWEEAKEMLDSGLIEIGSHTNSHMNFKTLSRAQTVFEIRKAKYDIEKNLGIKCNLFAYPYGFDNMYSLDELKKCGFDVVNMVGDKGTNFKEDGLYSLKRLTVSGFLSPERLLEMIEYNRTQ